MDPINYTFQAPNALDGILKGYQAGFGINQAQQEQAAAQAARQAAIAKQQQDAQVIQNLISNPQARAEDYANASLLVPQMREQFKQAWETRNTDQQKQQVSDLSQWSAAIQNGKPEVAVNAMKAKAQALENTAGAPTAESKALSDQAEVIKENPEFGNFMIKSLLAAHPDGKGVVDALAKQAEEKRSADQAPFDLRKKVADATTSEVKAKYADSQATMDLEKAGWDIKKVQADIVSQKEANRIAAMNAAVNREGNQLKRQELQLKLEDAKRERDDKIRSKVAEATAGANTIDNMLGTVDRILSNKSLDSVVGSLQGRVDAYLNDDAADAIAQIETLGSQVFLSQIPTMKGTGSLTEKEGDKLQSSLQNLGRVQSEAQFRENLENVKKLGMKARKGIEAKYGMPLGSPDNPYAPKPSSKTGANQQPIVVDF